jgi:3-oxoadipate enol-lactonase
MRLHYRLEGNADAPVLALPSSLGTSTDLWTENVEYWGERFRILCFDQRGHGSSEAPPGPYSLDDLGRDFIGLLDELELERVTLCGLSLGGATAMWVAAEAPERIDRLILACTSARFGEPTQWLERAEIVRRAGLEAIAEKVVARWFTDDIQPEIVIRFRSLLVSTPAEGYAASCEALAGWDFRGRLGEIRADTLVIAGAEDAAVPLYDSELLVERIPRARLVVLEQAAHLANVEQPESFAGAVLEAVPEAA